MDFRKEAEKLCLRLSIGMDGTQTNSDYDDIESFAQRIWNEAIEEAAKLAEWDGLITHNNVEDAIRALKRKEGN